MIVVPIPLLQSDPAVKGLWAARQEEELEGALCPKQRT